MRILITLFIFAFTAGGITGVLYLIYGRSLILKLWYRMMPGLLLAWLRVPKADCVSPVHKADHTLKSQHLSRSGGEESTS